LSSFRILDVLRVFDGVESISTIKKNDLNTPVVRFFEKRNGWILEKMTFLMKLWP